MLNRFIEQDAIPESIENELSCSGMLWRDWFNQPIELPFGYSIEIKKGVLTFSASRMAPANCDMTLLPRTFQSGLWQRDCAELFIADNVAGSSRYLELNLSPAGAWWGCVFKDVREPEQELSSLKPLCTSNVENEGWRTNISFPLAQLPIAVTPFSSVRMNVCAMLLQNEKQLFLSATKLEGEKPNFHQPGQFKEFNIAIPDEFGGYVEEVDPL